MSSNLKNFRILVVDDEPLIRQSLCEILRIDGYKVQMAASAEEAQEIIAQQSIDVVVTDLKLPKLSGVELLKWSKEKYPTVEFILITGYGCVETAVEAMKEGAFEYITKPINDEEIKILIRNIVDKKSILSENQALKEELKKERPASFAGMIGSSERIRKIYHTVQCVADSNATILITGESGTGKGMVAKAIHQSDKTRKDKRFIEVSCGALSETLLESELFGHVKGAFTGAIKDKEGRFEYADGGTIFLDEIDTFSPELQVKLLRVLQDGVFERVGDNKTLKAHARVIVATNKDLLELIEDGEFREDLYYRINVINIKMPPLRERKEDLEGLVAFFVTECARKNNKKIEGVSPEVMALFQDYAWPGNIRELQNAIEGAV
ncbi:MAG: sigma-54-dependent Fis family transcriptional regulator, partial [Candidatus Omnitrophica bacterium]|nr:sigma-54-dependent Fis family transcriptional regulator [Candidatus Omnitrophota bacterium]